MHNLSPDRAAQLKAEAVAARRAARAPWQNAHADRMAREREARRVAREAAQNTERPCKDCGDLKPPSAFELLPSGSLRGSCRDCRSAQKVDRKREARAARKLTPEYQAELVRRELEREQRREERQAAKDQELAKLQAAKEVEWAAVRAAELERRRKRMERKRGVRRRALSPEKLQEIAKRIPQLVSLLMGTNPGARIADQQSWEAIASELRQLWPQSGGKVCETCKATVSPSAMRPPGPANFYPGQCNRCARKAHLQDHRRVFGREPEGPRPIAMLDGSTLTIADLARRHRERERAHRLGLRH